MKPAATAEPITPATFGPIACISKKFFGLAFCPSTCDTRAAIGTAETPAEPINGLIFQPLNLHIILPNTKPPIVLNINANNPNPMIINVSTDKKVAALALHPTDNPNAMVTIFVKAF